MNKLLMALLFLTFVGAGVLFWLMKTYPVENVPLGAAETQGESQKEIEAPKEAHGADATSHSEQSAHTETPQSTPEASVHAEEKPESHSTPTEPMLAVKTSPVNAAVTVDGENVGNTPIEIPLKDTPQKIKLEAPGYSEVVREIPPRTKGDKDHSLSKLNWNIVLKARNEKSSTPKVAASSNAPVAAPPKVASQVLHGSKGPFWIQVKAFSAAEASQSQEFLKNTQLALGKPTFACDVALGDKGTWTRVLVGPYTSKSAAQNDVKIFSSKLNEPPFVTGTQKCL
jgi:hypothetical protein